MYPRGQVSGRGRPLVPGTHLSRILLRDVVPFWYPHMYASVRFSVRNLFSQEIERKASIHDLSLQQGPHFPYLKRSSFSLVYARIRYFRGLYYSIPEISRDLRKHSVRIIEPSFHIGSRQDENQNFWSEHASGTYTLTLT